MSHHDGRDAPKELDEHLQGNVDKARSLLQSGQGCRSICLAGLNVMDRGFAP